MFLKFKPFEGTRDWYFVDPDTGHKYQANSRDDLCNKIRVYRQQNELEEIEFLERVVENYLCTMPANFFRCHAAGKLERSVWQYVKGGIVLLRNMLIKNPVSQEEADRRSAICAACPFNGFPEEKTKYEKWSDQVAQASVPGKKSLYHSKLGNCAICTCCLKAKVFHPGPFELSKEEVEQLPDFCWQKDK